MGNVFSMESLQALLRNAGVDHQLRFVEVACALGVLLAVVAITRATQRTKATALRGPPNPSVIWGVDRMITEAGDEGLSYEKWAAEYGGVYEIPSALGAKKVVLCDPKAITHFYAGESFTYVLSPSMKIGMESFLGKGIFTAAGDDHRRQRKALAPAFTNVAIRNLAPVFFDSAHKCKSAWDAIIDSQGGRSAIIDVEEWMNHISLDSMGIAGFAHDFGTLNGKTAAIADALEVFGNVKKQSFLTLAITVLSIAFPPLRHVPTPLSKSVNKLNDAITDITLKLIAKSKKAGDNNEKSVLSTLLKNENGSGQRRITSEEVTAQVKALLLAGYETTSVSMTWALVELCKHPEIQAKLRAELLALGEEPTYDQLLNGLPYLDAVVHETLRMHVTIADAPRMASKDDTIPLSSPVRTRSGQLVDHITVAKGTNFMVSNQSMNRSELIWGPDAKEFKPERWILSEGIPAKAKEIQGYRHLLTFLDGPRVCLGKSFAVSEFKIAMSVLLRNFSLEFVDGPDTSIDMASCILPRPKLAASDRIEVPVRVTRLG